MAAMQVLARWLRKSTPFSILVVIIAGCGSHQEQVTTPVAVEAPAAVPDDYRGRTAHLLREDGIDLDDIHCNQRVIWAGHLQEDSQAFYRDLEAYLSPLMRRRIRRADREMAQEQIEALAMNWFIRALIIHGEQNNLGAVVIPQVQWTDDDGNQHPLTIFHSATTPYAAEDDSCFRSLLRNGRVRRVIKLYDGDVPLRDLLDAEAHVAEEMGAEYVDTSQGELTYRGWREIAANAEASDEERATAVERLTALIRDHILAPGGQAPTGNVYFHCAGGMHRSPLVAGILRRCVAQESADVVREAMQIHAAYQSSDDQGGWEQPLLDFVERFDCSLLDPAEASIADDAESAEAGADDPEGEASESGDSESATDSEAVEE